MNCTRHKMIEAVLRHGCTEKKLHLSQCIEDVADICCWHNQNNLGKGHDLGYEGPDPLEEINDIIQCIIPFTLPEIVIGLCQ